MQTGPPCLTPKTPTVKDTCPHPARETALAQAGHGRLTITPPHKHNTHLPPHLQTRHRPCQSSVPPNVLCLAEEIMNHQTCDGKAATTTTPPFVPQAHQAVGASPPVASTDVFFCPWIAIRPPV
ncbi:hypothetical protein B0I35DRAFT_50527 [Stachybotrys elegans]|uniref:Uncharacterized protein n=1 Tax=Stachybotrys elegans TaxID=80388 RepID=A0A8K0SQ90_9HYPO|nr:hypothetical protein B0I35DRAFT_50527 [Stachybotrys elegans]